MADPLDPPPLRAFPTREEAQNYCQTWAMKHGYALTVFNSKHDQYVDLACDRHGSYSGSLLTKRSRQTHTRKVGCKFLIHASCTKADPLWRLSYKETQHNHQPSEHPSVHPQLRRILGVALENLVEGMNDGLNTLQLKRKLSKIDGGDYVDDQTIYNTKQKVTLAELKGKSVMEVLYEQLEETSWIHRSKFSGEGHLEALYLAHPEAVKLSKQFHHIAMLDCTYKTNKYKTPLLHVVGMTANWKTFTKALVFITKETFEFYSWSVNALKELAYDPERLPKVFVMDHEKALICAIESSFPESSRQCCTWHLSKNIQANCKAQFFNDFEGWKSFMTLWAKYGASKTKEEAEVNDAELRVGPNHCFLFFLVLGSDLLTCIVFLERL